MALVPKVLLPESINQLRPISYCNFVYKIISKIIVSRLKGLMGHLISQNRSTFIGGSVIQDNLVVAQELIHALKKKDNCGKEALQLSLI